MLNHLKERHLDLSLYPTTVKVNSENVDFLLYDLTGSMVGVQVYNPKFSKTKKNNPHDGRYFTVMHKPGFWGLEYPLFKDYVFVQEGVFDACRLHSLGHPAIAVLGHSTVNIKEQLKLWGIYTLSISDGDKAGKMLGAEVDFSHSLCENDDVGNINDTYLKVIIESLINKTKECKNA